jgi:hypothetical protein
VNPTLKDRFTKFMKMKLTYLIPLFIFCFISSASGQGGLSYNELIKNLRKSPNCIICGGKGIQHMSGSFKTRHHTYCYGRGCSDCDYKGEIRYYREPYDYECGACSGSGKNAVLSELNNLNKLKKIYIKDHAEYVVLYGIKEDGFQQPTYEISVDDGVVEYLYYNDKTKRVFDQYGNPLFDIGYEDDHLVEFIYCGSHMTDNMRRDFYGENLEFNRRIGTSLFIAGQDYSDVNGANKSGSNFNVSVRYHYKNPEKIERPLFLNAVSIVDKDQFEDDYFNPKILDRYIVMTYVTIVYNTIWYGSELFSHVFNESMNGLMID